VITCAPVILPVGEGGARHPLEVRDPWWLLLNLHTKIFLYVWQLFPLPFLKLISELSSPTLESELRDDFRNRKYSVLIEESTDIYSDKTLCICVTYYSNKLNAVRIAFAGLVPIVEATGEVVFDAVKSRLEQYGLRMQDVTVPQQWRALIILFGLDCRSRRRTAY